MNCGIYKFCSIYNRNYFHISWKFTTIKFCNSVFQTSDYISWIFATKHNNNSLYYIILFVVTNLSQSRFCRYNNFSNVFYQNRCRTLNFYLNIFNILFLVQKSNSTNNVCLISLRNHISSNIDITF